MTDIPASREPAPAKRTGRDRRREPSEGRRGKPRRSLLGAVWRDVVAVVVLVAGIVFLANHIHPIFAGQAPVVARVLPAIAPTRDSTIEERIQGSAQFAHDSAAFAADLVRTGHVEPARADSIAFYAVREAYRRGIPPAVMFGVMLTENALFISSAQSNVGAVGLMQVYPKIWLKALGAKFGRDLTSDSTNVKYGAFILSQYINPKGRDSVSAADVRKGLLRYNGCVHGTNTPNCTTYPSKVQRYVETKGSSLCGAKGFYDCIAKPFLAGLLGEK